MIKSNCIGHSPGAEGESLSDDGGLPKGSAAGLRYKYLTGTVGGGGTRGAAVPGKQFRERVDSACTLGFTKPDAIDFENWDKQTIRLSIHRQRTYAQSVEKARCTSPCESCSIVVARYYNHLQSCILQCGDWMEDRISLEKRLRRRVTRLGTLLSKIGVGHYRRELFFDRLPYLSDFQLTVDDYSLIIMVGVVSELSWRYDAFKWEA